MVLDVTTLLTTDVVVAFLTARTGQVGVAWRKLNAAWYSVDRAQHQHLERIPYVIGETNTSQAMPASVLSDAA
jgi:hypothetical protein